MWQSSADNLAVHVGQGKQRLLNGKVVGAMWLCALVTPLPQLVWREDDDVLVKDITTAGGAEGPMPWLASQWAHTEKGSNMKMDQPKKKDAADKDERETNATHKRSLPWTMEEDERSKLASNQNSQLRVLITAPNPRVKAN